MINKTRLLKPEIADKLVSLRRLLRARLAGEGVSWLIVTLVTAVFVSLAFDYTLRLDKPLRGLMAAGCLGAMVYVLWRTLLRPLNVEMSTAQLALLVENHYTQLEDRLISTVQFDMGLEGMSDQSRSMITHTANQASEMAAGMDFTAIVERGNLRRRLAMAAAAALLLGGFSTWKTDVLSLWFARNVVFAEVAWPQSVYLDVSGETMDDKGNFKVLRGDDLSIIVTARLGTPQSVAPAEIVLHTHYPSLGGTEDRLGSDSNGKVTYTYAFRGVSENLTFYVVGGDDKRRIKHKVKLVEPPSLSDVLLEISHPAYMNASLVRLSNTAVLPMPPGSRVSVSALADKSLTAAGIYLDDKRVAMMKICAAGKRGSDSTRVRVAGEFELPRKITRSKDRKSLWRTMRIELTDTEGFVSKEAAVYRIRITPDMLPAVSVKKTIVSGSITPEARIPLAIDVKDDHGLAAVGVKVVSNKQTIATRPVLPPEHAGSEAALNYVLDLKGLGLKAGMSLQVSVSAIDNMPADFGGPNVGKSGVLMFTVVSREKMLAAMIRRQKEIRTSFEQAIRSEQDAIGKVADARVKLKGSTVSQDVRDGLKNGSMLQASVNGECVKAAVSMQAVMDEMSYNRVITPQSAGAMKTGVIEPLNTLGREMETLCASMGDGRKDKNVASLGRRIADISARQAKMLAEMRAILVRMVKIAETEELAARLETIIRRWQGVVDETTKRGESAVDDVFESD